MNVGQGYRVQWADGSLQDVMTTGRTLLAYERLTDQSALDLVRYPDRVTTWYSRVWAELHSTGQFPGGRDVFTDAVAFVWPADPTAADPTAAPDTTGADGADSA